MDKSRWSKTSSVALHLATKNATSSIIRYCFLFAVFFIVDGGAVAWTSVDDDSSAAYWILCCEYFFAVQFFYIYFGDLFGFDGCGYLSVSIYAHIHKHYRCVFSHIFLIDIFMQIQIHYNIIVAFCCGWDYLFLLISISGIDELGSRRKSKHCIWCVSIDYYIMRGKNHKARSFFIVLKRWLWCSVNCVYVSVWVRIIDCFYALKMHAVTLLWAQSRYWTSNLLHHTSFNWLHFLFTQCSTHTMRIGTLKWAEYAELLKKKSL